MQPVPRERLAGCCLALRYLVRVMNCYMVHAAAVNVYRRPEIFHRHRAALYVPPWEPAAKRRIPFHVTFCFRELPQRKIRRVNLPFGYLHPCACLKALNVQPRQLTVVLEFRSIEIDAVLDCVRIAAVLQRLHKICHFLYVVRRPYPRRLFHAQCKEVLFERVYVEIGQLPGRFSFTPRADFHLVLAFVRIRGHVPDVGKIHDLLDGVAVKFQYPPKQVLENKSPQVSDVSVVVHGRSASVQQHISAVKRLELFFLARQGVVDF